MIMASSSGTEGKSSRGRLKIMHVLFSPRIAGSERYCIDLANGQAALGHEVHVVGRHGSPMEGQFHASVSFHGLRMSFLRGLRLKRLVAETGVDIVHAHLSPACKALQTVKGRVARIATLHVGYKPGQHARLDGLICVNHAQTQRLGSYTGLTEVIPNWLPDAETTSDFRLRDKLHLSPDVKIVGSVGRLHRSKGCDLLLSAFRKTAPANAALVFAGDGPERKALEQQAGGDSRIHFIGYCDNVPGFLRDLDLFVSPSLEETAGLAILEAMRAGLPIISTATDGPSEYLKDYPVTFVEIGSEQALANALAVVFQPDKIAAPGRLCYDLSPFERSKGIASVLNFYLRVARRS